MHTVIGCHPTGAIVLLRVHSVPQEVNLFLISSHLSDGTFNSACESSHGSRWCREVLVSFLCAHAGFLSGAVGIGGEHYEAYDDRSTKLEGKTALYSGG